MIKKFIGAIVLGLYLLVLAVAVTNGPLISFQSIVLGLVGLIVIIIGISSIARTIHLVDIPDNIRKKHVGNVPLIGGVVLFFSIIYGSYVFGVDPFYRSIIMSLTPIIIIGILDGLKDFSIPVSFRLIAQILASWIVILSTNIYLRDLGDLMGLGIIFVGQLGIPFTIFAVVGVCNAFNMLDGKDGLTGSVSVVIISSLLLLLYLNGIIFSWGLILISSLLVFLAFNLNLFGQERKIFLGDHGSAGLGHIIAWNLIYLSQEIDLITPVSALWFIFLPLTDALLTMVRRFRRASTLHKPDRQHLHHLLSDRGWSDKQVLLTFVIVSVISSFIAVLSNYWNLPEYNHFFGYITVFIVLVILGTSKPENT